MKYPITPDFLAELPDDAVALYEELERKILQKICEQFNFKGEPNATSLELIRLLQRRGLPLSDIEEYIKKTLKLSQTELDNIFQIGIDRNQEYYDDVLSKQQLIGDTARYASIMQEVDAIAQQTHDTFTNITRSMGFALRGNDGKVQVLPIQKTYQRILDDAEIEVWSGASTYDEAIKNATRRLSESGLQWVDYDSGYHNRVDVAVRRAVMTGITQMSAVYSDNLADELDTHYIEVTAHRGARDIEGKTPWSSHKAWQGKVYSKRAGDIYPSVYAVCGLGEVDGLCGVNCRHHYYPFVDGVSERTCTDEELANIDPPPFEFEGKKYSAYEATQKQRQIESTMRSIKRRMVASKAAGLEDDYTDYSVRYRRLNDEYEKFSKAAGLPTQKQRISDYSNKIIKNLLYNSEKSNIIKHESGEMKQHSEETMIPANYSGEFSEYESLDLNDVELSTFKKLHELGTSNDNEHGIAIIDGKATDAYTNDLHDKVKVPEEYSSADGVKLYHCHTNHTPPSIADMRFLLKENVAEIGTVNRAGDVYTVSVGNGERVSLEEYTEITDKIYEDVVNSLFLDYPEFYEWTKEERKYMAARERFYKIVRRFKWLAKGGNIL